MFTADVGVLEGREGGRGAGGGGCGGPTQPLQSVGHQDFPPGHVFVRGDGGRSRLAAVARVGALPGPLQVLPGLLPQLQVGVGVAP